jgi:hypothetical protein
MSIFTLNNTLMAKFALPLLWATFNLPNFNHCLVAG